MFTHEELKNLLALIQRAQITGTEAGVVVMLSAGVGVAVGAGVTFHIQVCISCNSVTALVAITETFQVPATAFVFVYTASIAVSFICTSVLL